jgi:hypothetical protein
MKNISDKISMKFTRSNGKAVIFIKLPSEVSDLFASDTKQKSLKYTDSHGNDLTYFSLSCNLTAMSREYNTSFVKNTQFQSVTLRRYGSTLFFKNKEGRQFANLSILRTVGIQTGIELCVPDQVSELEVASWMTELCKFVAALIQSQSIGESVIEAYMTVVIH